MADALSRSGPARPSAGLAAHPRPVRSALLHPIAKPIVFVLSLLPFAWLVAGTALQNLGPNPAEALIRATGDWTLRMLCLVLAVTPLRVIAATPPIVRVLDDLWHMCYLTGRKWLFEEGKFEPVYQIARATSDDGLNWQRDGQPIIPTLSDDECQDIASPFRLDGKWHAVFAWRRPSTSAGAYRLGQASSADLKSWVRDDSQVGIGLSATGWDSQMMCYAQVLEVDGRVLLFYCGNDFGRAGFGIAELTGHGPEKG